MQHRGEHALERLIVIEQDRVGVQSDRTFPFAQEHRGTVFSSPGPRPIWQPAHTDVTSEPTGEEDEVEVAECLYDEIRTPGALPRCSYRIGKALDGFTFQSSWFSVQVVVLEDFKTCLPWGNEGAMVGFGEPFLSRRAAVFGPVSWEVPSG